MSNTIQNINEISPMAEGQNKAAATDPVQAEYEQGKTLLERNETGPAAVALHNALLGFEENDNDNGIANASNQLGKVCVQRGEYEKALKHFQRAEEICRKLQDPLSLAALSRQFILVYTETERYKEAISRCLDLIELYQRNNDPKGTVEIIENMADIYVRSGELAKAADAYRTIASIHRNFKHEKTAGQYIDKAEELEKRS